MFDELAEWLVLDHRDQHVGRGVGHFAHWLVDRGQARIDDLRYVV